MFFNGENNKKIVQLEEDMKKLKKEFESLKLDVTIWYNKLKTVKNVKPIQEDSAEKDLLSSVLLPEYGQSHKVGKP